MPHTYSQILIHAVFSTKERRPLIKSDWQDRLYKYIAGIVTDFDGHLIRAGGVADHVHLLIQIPTTISVSDAMRLIKTNSSKWVHDEFPSEKAFAWQSGYGAFSVSASMKDVVVDYINRQEEHHRTQSFQEEYVALLQRHGIEYDERYLWD